MPESKVYTAIGLMSGTSLDGVDCAAIETDGRDFFAPINFLTIPYTPEERAVIRACFGLTNRNDPKVTAAERMLTLKHAQAVKALPIKGEVIGFHGQTIYHAPKDGITLQIGDGALLAAECGMDVVYDFRSADVRAGGEGAPLAPAYHAARVKGARVDLPVVILNIGGVANVTYIDENSIIAFDTGPGNALMDDWVKARTGAAYDEDGKIAASGRPLQALLNGWYSHEYFSRKPPKSLDRDKWDIAALGPMVKDLWAISTEDGAATLLRFTGDMIAKSAEHMPRTPKAWYACGGGRHNKALMAYLNERLGPCVKSVDDLGWDGDATEAECFAYLAVRSLMGLPISFPGTTGVPEPMTGGVLNKV
jgi:anhydro-N-acetylmuramic acid kinase